MQENNYYQFQDLGLQNANPPNSRDPYQRPNLMEQKHENPPLSTPNIRSHPVQSQAQAQAHEQERYIPSSREIFPGEYEKNMEEKNETEVDYNIFIIIILVFVLFYIIYKYK